MALVYDTKEYSPAELAKTLADEFGHKVTPSVIRKWDNEIYSEISDKKRDKSEARNYRYNDLVIFNAIAVLRSMGYSVEDVKNILLQTKASTKKKESPEAKPDMVLNIGGQKVIIEVKGNMEKQRKGFGLLEEYFGTLQKR